MRSLRGRLTGGVMLVLAAVLAVSLVGVSRYVARSDRRAVDDRLTRAAALSQASAVAAFQDSLPDADRRLDGVLSASGISLRLFLGSTDVLDTGRPPPLRSSPRIGLRTVAVNGRDYRLSTTVVRDPALSGLARLEVATSLAGIEHRQTALDRRLAALGLVALLVAGLGSWLAAGAVLRPVRRLRAVAGSIASDEDLARRVPIDDGPAEQRALAASVNAMLARLERSAADRERALAATRRFAADAGHELRTPLTTVQTTLGSLHRHPELPAARRTAMVGDALAEHARLAALLDGLQAMARADAAPPATADVDLVEAVDGAIGATAVEADVPDQPVLVRGWEPGLRLIADNLLQNAVRHGGGGRVRVAVQPAAGDRGPRLVVEDDGPGIPAADRDRVLEPFARLEGAPPGGSGLGLALVAQQVRLHGATLQVSDGAWGGARLTVTFPATGEGG